MKADIHPKYTDVNVKCSCGNAFTTRSTYGKEDMTIDVCSECHPFYTGKQKVSDTGGRPAELFRFRHEDNLSIREIANRTGRTADAIRSSLYRVKKLIVEAVETEQVQCL